MATALNRLVWMTFAHGLPATGSVFEPVLPEGD
jgi:hypothetical protein